MPTEYLDNKAFEVIIANFQKTKKLKLRYELLVEFLNEMIDAKKKSKINASKDKKDLGEFQAQQIKNNAQFHSNKEHLCRQLLILAQNVVGYTKFSLIDADDAIQESVMVCFDKIDRFVPSKGKAFNYMTTVIFNSLRQLYRSAKNYNEFKKKLGDFLELSQGHTAIKNGKKIILE